MKKGERKWEKCVAHHTQDNIGMLPALSFFTMVFHLHRDSPFFPIKTAFPEKHQTISKKALPIFLAVCSSPNSSCSRRVQWWIFQFNAWEITYTTHTELAKVQTGINSHSTQTPFSEISKALKVGTSLSFFSYHILSRNYPSTVASGHTRFTKLIEKSL